MNNVYDNKLKSILYKEIKDDLDTQEKYFKHLNYLIDAVIDMRFKKYRNNFISIDEMDFFLKQAVDYVCEKKDEKYLKLITEEIINKVNKAFSWPVNLEFLELHNYVLDVYHMVSYADVFPKETVNEMYSLILNRIYDGYFKITKKEIKEQLCEELDYTKKKEESIITGYKLDKVVKAIKNKEYKKINITKKQLMTKATYMRTKILNMKDIKKSKLIISDDIFNYFEERFVEGALSIDEISKLLDCLKNIAKSILKKYNEILWELSTNYEIDNVDKNKLLYQRRHKVGFDYNNFVIVNNQDNLYYVDEIEKLLPTYVKEKIVSNPRLYEEITFLIPFLDFFPELNVDKYCKILKNYPVVKEEILKQKITKDTYITDQEWIESHILDVITLALGYSEINEAEYALLGKEVYEKNPLRSSKYAEFYLKMLNKKSSYLPIVKGEYQGYKYEMSNYTDRNRLLLGVNCEGSCMDLFHNKGHETYEKVLLDKNADVVMITDQNNQFYGRILAFRKGNFVLLGPIRNKYLNHERNEFDKNLVKHIALSILKSAMKKEDNLDFVFMANTVFYNDHHQNINDFVTLKDERFATLFPHADLDEKVLVLAHNPNKMYVSFDVEPKEEYFKTHPKINYQPTNEDVLRIIAINKLLQNDDNHIIKPFDITNYYQVMVGEMWYLALRRDNTLEECLLPNADKVNVNEFVNTKMRLMDMIETNKFSL